MLRQEERRRRFTGKDIRQPLCHRSQHRRVGPRVSVDSRRLKIHSLTWMTWWNFRWIRETYRGERTGPDSYDTVLYSALRDPETRKALASGMKDAREHVLRKFAI